MIEKTFINPTTNKQWRIEIDGYTIRTCLNGGKVKETLCDSAYQVKSKAASAMMGQMRKGFVYQNPAAAVGQVRCHRFVGKDSNGFMPLATALTRDDFSRSFFADSSYMLSFSVLCSCVCSRLISPSVSSWHKQDNTLMHQSPGHIQRRTPYNF